MKRITLFLLSTILLSACADQLPGPDGWLELTIEEGKHAAKPYQYSHKERTYLAYEWRFDESAVYNLQNGDQCDWNKLTGISLHHLSNHKNSIMVSWRYDLDGFLWIAPYYHEDGNTFWASKPCTSPGAASVNPPLEGMRLDIGDVLEAHINVDESQDYTALTIINTSTGETIFWEKYWYEFFDKTREIYPWFGGNEESPHDIFIYRRLIADE